VPRAATELSRYPDTSYNSGPAPWLRNPSHMRDAPGPDFGMRMRFNGHRSPKRGSLAV